MSYWTDRTAKAQAALTKKNIRQTEKQLQKYYLNTSKRIIKEYEAIHKKLKKSMEEGKEPTPAHLYKLDSYWSMQGQLKQELEKLGNRQIKTLNKKFEKQFLDVYNSFALEGVEAFSTIDKAAVTQMINQIWVADGKSYSQRIWDNTDLLLQTLNEELIHSVVAGTKTTDLKKKLQERFNVAYHRADSVVRTELAHIQTQAAEQRYKDYGIQEVEVWADEDERRCKTCGKLHQKRYKIGATIPIPAHPNCRCCIVPVVEDEQKIIVEDISLKEKQTLTKKDVDDKLSIDAERIKAAQDRVDEIQTIERLHLNSYNKSHRRHALDLTGLQEDVNPAVLWQEYENMCTEFFKASIDGKNIDGFIDDEGTLYKMDFKRGIFGKLFKNNKVASIYEVENPERYWEKWKKGVKKNEKL